MKKFNFFLFPLLLFLGCSSAVNIADIKILPREVWNADTPNYYTTHVPQKITIHHEGTIFTPEKDAPAHIKNVQKWGMSEARYWADIPYHFLIDPNGNIYEGRNPFTAGETATEYDPSGHLLITCMGNYEEQELSSEQLNSLIQTVAWACDKYRISPDSIAAHKDFANTACPGKNLYKYIENGYLKEQVIKVLN
jgi:hypothetical protein